MKYSLFPFAALLVFTASCGETAEVADEKNDSAQIKAPDTIPTKNDVMAAPKVFYYDYKDQRGVEEALVMTEEAAYHEMEALPEVDGNFFGLELADGKIVQFMYDGNKSTWFLDIPNPVTQESYNADLTREQVMQIISDVFAGKNADDIQAAYK